jgi:hypothetical protein
LKRAFWFAINLSFAITALPQPAATASLHGVVTDPSGASVPGALVQLRGPFGGQETRTDNLGRYSFTALLNGNYAMRVIAEGFSVDERNGVDVSGETELNSRLVILPKTQVVNVDDDANRVSADPESNGASLALREKELATLSDNSDELLQELQSMTSAGASPNRSQIYIDGFIGGNMPPKSEIREVRINSNPFSAEYDRPGFSRIEILTKPGADNFHGQVYGQFNKEAFNSRSPLLAQSMRPPYEQYFSGLNLGGPIKKEKASFTFSLEDHRIKENAFVLATTLDTNLNPVTVNQAVVTPQAGLNFGFRVDHTINSRNTLIIRYQHSSTELDKQGIGGFDLATRAYDRTKSEDTVQIRQIDTLTPKAVNELRFQYMRTNLANASDNTVPAISVQDSFTGGGSQVGNSGNTQYRWEMTNTTTTIHGPHVIRWGGRLRRSLNSDTSVTNFGGTYTFFGGNGPELDANNQPILGTSINLTALERYRRTLLFEQFGLAPMLIRALGGGASVFSLNGGTPTTWVGQFEIGMFANDDWLIRPNVTISYGLRYETQTNIHDFSDWAPRAAIAWGIGGTRAKPAKTVLHAGLGTFYDRVADSITLQADRFNGTTQQSYFILNPNFFPIISTPASLGSAQQPQQLQLVYRGIDAPRTYQFSVGIDQEINKYFRFTTQYIENRGVHLQRTRDINVPINGVYPFGDQVLRKLTESSGFSRSHVLVLSPNVNYQNIFIFGFYAFSYGDDDVEGSPADPYNLHAEWGPSTIADVHHRAIIGAKLPLPWKMTISPFLMANSGTPYNITTGRDTNGDGAAAERPALVTGLRPSSCKSGNMVYAQGYGCFNLLPVPGVSTIERNFGRGPGFVMLVIRLGRTWAFGERGETSRTGADPTGAAMMKARVPPPPSGGPTVFTGSAQGSNGASNKKYKLALSVNATNVLNHANFAAPIGDLSSPYFGQSLVLAGGLAGPGSTYNRKIDFNLVFAF